MPIITLVVVLQVPQLVVQAQLTPPFESTVHKYPVLQPQVEGLRTVPLLLVIEEQSLQIERGVKIATVRSHIQESLVKS